MKTIRLQLETLTCPSCVTRIEGVLNKEPGVENAKVLFNSSKVKIEYNSSTIDENQLSKIVEGIGFPVIS